MDTLCGIGLPELIIIVLIGFVLIGPERSQELALKMGRLLRQVMTSEWWHEFNQVSKAIKDLPTTLIRMSEIEEAQKEIRQAMVDIETSTQVGFDEQFPGSLLPGKQRKADGDPVSVATDQEAIASNTLEGDEADTGAESTPHDASIASSTTGNSAPKSDAATTDVGADNESASLDVSPTNPGEPHGEAADV